MARSAKLLGIGTADLFPSAAAVIINPDHPFSMFSTFCLYSSTPVLCDDS